LKFGKEGVWTDNRMSVTEWLSRRCWSSI